MGFIKTLSLKDFGWYIMITFQVMTYGLYGIYVHLRETKDGHLPFNATSLNFLIEFLKLIVCLICYLFLGFKNRDESQTSLAKFFISLRKSKEISFRKSLYFSIPGLSYTINNNLSKQILHFFCDLHYKKT